MASAATPGRTDQQANVVEQIPVPGNPHVDCMPESYHNLVYPKAYCKKCQPRPGQSDDALPRCFLSTRLGYDVCLFCDLDKMIKNARDGGNWLELNLIEKRRRTLTVTDDFVSKTWLPLVELEFGKRPPQRVLHQITVWKKAHLKDILSLEHGREVSPTEPPAIDWDSLFGLTANPSSSAGTIVAVSPTSSPAMIKSEGKRPVGPLIPVHFSSSVVDLTLEDVKVRAKELKEKAEKARRIDKERRDKLEASKQAQRAKCNDAQRKVKSLAAKGEEATEKIEECRQLEERCRVEMEDLQRRRDKARMDSRRQQKRAKRVAQEQQKAAKERDDMEQALETAEAEGAESDVEMEVVRAEKRAMRKAYQQRMLAEEHMLFDDDD